MSGRSLSLARFQHALRYITRNITFHFKLLSRRCAFLFLYFIPKQTLKLPLIFRLLLSLFFKLWLFLSIIIFSFKQLELFFMHFFESFFLFSYPKTHTITNYNKNESKLLLFWFFIAKGRLIFEPPKLKLKLKPRCSSFKVTLQPCARSLQI